MVLLLLFIFGICIGSFLNVVIDRIPQGISILKGRSRCDSCHHQLAWYDLFPIVSFLALSGRCRYCKVKLSFQYPLIEVLTGILFTLSYLFSGSPTDFVGLAKFIMLICLFSIFFALAVMDWKYGILSDKLVIASGVVASLLFLFSPSLLLIHGIVGLICFGILLLLFLSTKGRGIGLGDVKLSFVMGIFLGFPTIVVAFYLAFLTGAFVAIILVIAKRKMLIGGTIAFGPFLLLGTYISWYFGNTLWILLLHLLGVL